MIRIILLLTAITLTACQTANNDEAAFQTKQNADPLVVYTQDEKKIQKSANEIAKHLVELSTSVPNVNDATAIVTGKYAIVGIDVDKETDRSHVGSIKYSVAEALQQDPYGARAIVVADPDSLERLKGIQRKVSDGHPISAFTEELSAIIGRVIPQVPSDLRPVPISEEKESGPLKDEGNKQLQEEQQKQAQEVK
ncbi:YhcN/YlaJ family sporulation lipoprotein [Bacillus solimangrovi]|uniref:YhcN/YlaJ family sporulation lipoprotein n=1 Tax=Bacillus solimangrovi TaxID=1305675 RepID=A0A1E5LIK5_9BACI|nr:YhcN/YlaJ family sporulation lipoprotein [Bacillus solimangrovi]OEH93905.1 hypothetical protein BFG57_10570 [Bacillus solimangrovi]